jgi:hypothetical protein
MKKISLIALTTLFSLSIKSQSNSQSAKNFDYIKIDSKTHVLKRDCQIIIVTQDSSVISNVKNAGVNHEIMSCYDSNQGQSTMIWLSDKQEDFVNQMFSKPTQIFVENSKK